MQVLTRYLTLAAFYHWSGRWLPWLVLLAVLCLGSGIYLGLVVVPADYQQGETFRIFYLHVPAAMLSLLAYTFIALCAAGYLIWQLKLLGYWLQAAIPLGWLLTLLALLTGAIWGKPMWGTWWIWDARLTSELILLFLYSGLGILAYSLKGHRLQTKATAMVALIGFIDIPIVHYSVQWWTTLHQGATFSLFQSPRIAVEMLYPLYFTFAGFVFWFIACLLHESRMTIIYQQRQTRWVSQLFAS